MEDTQREAPSGTACPDCRALVADAAAHARWHSRLVSDLAKAIEAEIKRGAKVAG